MEKARKRLGLVAGLTGLILAVLGLVLLGGGTMLLWLGGSAYYGIAGLLVLASAFLLFRRRAEALWVYAAMLAASAGWAVWESGLDGWALSARLTAPLALGLWLATPWVRRPLTPRAGRLGPTIFVTAMVAGLLLAAAGLVRERAPDPLFANITQPAVPPAARASAITAVPADWPAYGNDPGGARYSALDRIDAGNVDRLQVAWTFRTGPAPIGFASFSATPIKLGDTLYFCTGYNDVIALDAETGRQKWRYYAHVDLRGAQSQTCRGVSHYRAEGAADCVDRILTNTLDARLIALDAATGVPCRSFGRNGEVSLLDGMGEVTRGYVAMTSAPTVARDRIVIGGRISDGQYWGEPSGVVRAFDARAGRLVWALDVGRPDRAAAPAPGESYTQATPNAWAPMSVDEQLGLVYIPTGNATPDYYGAQRRPFDDRYSSSVLAVDIATGRLRWSYQTLHHDLWDYDVGSQPTLFDLQTPSGPRKALLQPTKRGELFLLDRVTGQPLAPVVERPVPQRGAAPGERLSPTQPFPVGMPSLRGPNLTEAMMWGLTPLDQLWCRIRFRQARYEGPMTPPGLTSSVFYPGFMGGMNWGSATVDPDNQLMVINSNYLAAYMHFISRAEGDRLGIKRRGSGPNEKVGSANNFPQEGTPYAVLRTPFLSPLGVPCQQPPFGRLTAIDLRTRKVAWTHAFGTAREAGPWGMKTGLPFTMGVPNLGGAITTRGGLTFIGASQDRRFRAYDSRTGKLLWQAVLPAGGHATPMTYLSPKGRQMIVIAAGGHALLQSKTGDYLVAYALPRGDGGGAER